MSGVALTAFWVITAILSAAAGLGAYLAPSIVALVRRAPNTSSVVAVNVLLGWSLIGWAIALAMALRSAHPDGGTGPVTVIQNAAPTQPAPSYATWPPPQHPAAALPRPEQPPQDWPPRPHPLPPGAPPHFPDRDHDGPDDTWV